MAQRDLPVLSRLSDLVELVRREKGLYVRWSHGPARDLVGPASMDALTGVPLPGLSASPLDPEDWWGDRSLRLWVARRLYDYCHLRVDKGPGVSAYVLRGREVGRGPDNEPLIENAHPVALVDDAAIEEARHQIGDAAWGPLRRTRDTPA